MGAAVAGRRAAPAPAPRSTPGARGPRQFNTKTKASRVPPAASTYDRRDLEAGIVQAFEYGREVTSGELEALVHEGVVEHHRVGEGEPGARDDGDGPSASTGTSCRLGLAEARWLGIDMDSDAALLHVVLGVDVDFSFEITTGCRAVRRLWSYEFAKGHDRLLRRHGRARRGGGGHQHDPRRRSA